MDDVVHLSEEEDDGDVYPPWNFTWVVRDRLAAMACPHRPAHLRFLAEQGICHLVTLSPEKKPPSHLCDELDYSTVPVDEFDAPTIKQIEKFIEICRKCTKRSQAIGVHCRMGRGRTGVMAACYLMRFNGHCPERAITTVRMARPGSIETYDQEKIIHTYYDFMMGEIQS
ncbi:dual specificity protein phosphatase 23 [Nilaparvata lugens]|uniref:dual specificity protein phosphatase 23 n=1 Tax=Nilaparvata lugens TaxID=108931 RepID=UPI000B98858A|nr:dual specificity protein phosphatase 23 [Nilaparvata lugens]